MLSGDGSNQNTSTGPSGPSITFSTGVIGSSVGDALKLPIPERIAGRDSALNSNVGSISSAGRSCGSIKWRVDGASVMLRKVPHLAEPVNERKLAQRAYSQGLFGSVLQDHASIAGNAPDSGRSQLLRTIPKTAIRLGSWQHCCRLAASAYPAMYRA